MHHDLQCKPDGGHDSDGGDGAHQKGARRSRHDAHGGSRRESRLDPSWNQWFPKEMEIVQCRHFGFWGWLVHTKTKVFVRRGWANLANLG